MDDPKTQGQDSQLNSKHQFWLALAIGTMTSSLALFIAEYFGIVDVIKGWP